MKDFLQRVLPFRGRWLRTSYATAVAALLFASCSKQEAEPAAAPDNTNTSTASATVTDGVYTLTARHSGKRLDVYGLAQHDGAEVVQWEAASGLNQQWKLTAVGEGYYTLIAQHSGKALDVANSSTANGAKVQQYHPNPSGAQRWKIEATSGGYYTLTNQTSGKALDVYGGPGATGNQARVTQWSYVGGTNQQWKIEPVTGGGGTTPGTGGAVSGPPAGTGSWTKSFEDNFDTFDASKWVKRWASGNGRPLGDTYQDRLGTAYEDANVWVANGELHIKTERKSTRGNAFTSGVVTTGKEGGFMQQYGYFEVRMKPASSPGNDPCFWAFPLSKPSALPYKEIDFAEFGGAFGGNAVALTTRMPGKPFVSFSKTGSWTSGFHTYGVLWEAGKATLYIDGVQQGAITKDIVDEAGVLILSDEVRKDEGAWFGNSDNFGGPVTTEAEWVRVWRHS